MTTLDHRPPESTGHQPYRDAALRFLATGMTAEGVRAHAADAFYVSLTARIAGVTPQEAYTELLAIAGAIASLENHHLSPQYAYFLAGMDKQYGPYPGPDTLRVA